MWMWYSHSKATNSGVFLDMTSQCICRIFKVLDESESGFAWLLGGLPQLNELYQWVKSKGVSVAGGSLSEKGINWSRDSCGISYW